MGTSNTSDTRERQQHLGTEQVPGKKLSATMAMALAETIDHGGELVRFVGGYWSYEGVNRQSHNGVPEWHVGTTTVEALVARDMLEYVEWKDGRNGRFPIRAKLTARSQRTEER